MLMPDEEVCSVGNIYRPNFYEQTMNDCIAPWVQKPERNKISGWFYSYEIECLALDS